MKNPAKKFIKYSGKAGKFSYYNKETKENINLQTPFTFTVLDELSTITGWHDNSESGIYSNEVHRIAHDELTIKAFKGGEIARGYYSSIKDKIKAAGGKYAKVLYALLDNELVNIQLTGCSLSPWIDKEFDVHKVSVKFEKTTEEKKGSTTYYTPVFEPVEMEDMEKAIEFDKELQKYFSQHKDKINRNDKAVQSEEKTTETSIDAIGNSEIKVEDLPF